MKKVATRGVFALLLTAVLVIGLLVFVAMYFVNGQDWITFSGSPHVYTGGNLNAGVIYDRDGATLLDTSDGRVYAEDATLRASTLHWFGDREGYIGAPLLTYYADDLVGYSPITGIYSLGDQPVEGVLTLDGNLQIAALEALGDYAGTVAVYNYETGELLCAVTSPNYDPDNVPDIDGDTTGQYSGVYVNRLMNSTYTPGSVFKIVTAAAALETIDGVENQIFHCDGCVEIQGDTVTCASVHGDIDLETALAKSCNVAFAELALQLGGDTLDEYAEKMGITTSYEVDGYTTKTGSIAAGDAQSVNVAWSGIGQYTDQINPYGFLQTMGAIGGGGTAKQAYFMAEIDGQSQSDLGDVTIDLSPETCQELAEMMAYNTESVYGSTRFGNLTVCAKSGTAEVGNDVLPHAVFAGFVDDDQYPVAFFALVENGGSGSTVAGDVIAAVLLELQK